MLTYKQFHVTHAKVWIGHSEKAERICVKTKTGTAGRKYSRERETKSHMQTEIRGQIKNTY